MLITLLEISQDYCFIDYPLTNKKLDALDRKHWLNALYNEYKIGKFKRIFGSDYFSKHINFIEINKIPNINLKNQNITIDWIDICGFDERYLTATEALDDNSYFVLSIRGELIFDVPKKVLLEWADVIISQDIAINEEFKFNTDKFYSWHRKETDDKDGSIYSAGNEIWDSMDYWLGITTDDPKIDCFSTLDGGYNDFHYNVLEENIENAIASLNSKI